MCKNLKLALVGFAVLSVGLETAARAQDAKQETSSPQQQGTTSASPKSGQDSAASGTATPNVSSASQPTPHKNAAAKKKTRHRRPAQTQSGKTVVRNGGAREQSVELSPDMSKDQEAHNRENTNQLLATTNDNLKNVEGRSLSASQQSMLDQIHSYLRQAKAASDAGDFTRAHTLAYKAHLLSDELAKK